MTLLRVCLAGLVLLAPAFAVDFGSRINRVDAMAAAEWGQDRIGSLTVGVIEDGKLAWTKSYGDADMEKHIPAGRDTVYRIGSITKQFTAVMLSQLVEQGRAHLSDPAQKYVPELRRVRSAYPDASPVSLFQLATHTSGLAREPADTDIYSRGPVEDWEKTLLAALAHTEYSFEPGIRYSYSNIGYAVLGLAMERAAGRPYVSYVTDQIFRPLRMNHTGFEWTPALKEKLAKGYEVVNGKASTHNSEREDHGRGFRVPNGGAYSTVGDLARFAALWLGDAPESVLKKATLEEILAEVVAADPDLKRGYGRGFMVSRRGAMVSFGHGGSVAGFLAALYVNRATRCGVVVLANESGGKARPSIVANRMLDVLSGN